MNRIFGDELQNKWHHGAACPRLDPESLTATALIMFTLKQLTFMHEF